MAARAAGPRGAARGKARTRPLVLLLLAVAAAAAVAAPCAGSSQLGELVGRAGRSAWQAVAGLADEALGLAGRAGHGLAELCREGVACPPADPDARRNVSQIIRSRGFQAEEHRVITGDGYILIVQRVVNPLVPASLRAKLRPVIMQHGLMSSSVDWVINSRLVRPALPAGMRASDAGGQRPSDEPARDEDNELAQDELAETQEHPNSLAFYLANRGYDVWLANSRGNIYGQRHQHLSSWEPKFWNFTFDEQIAYDLPDTIAYVQRQNGHRKVAYVGHSQGTTMALGLLSERPEYSQLLQPVVLLAPVAYVSHALSPVKYFSVYTPLFQHVNWWFGTSNAAVRYLGPIVCGPKVIRRDLCANIVFLSVGFDQDELDDERVSAYLSHMPSGTSVKNVAHYGQEVLSGRFAKFDHGLLGNQVHYGRTKSPDYRLDRINSTSLALFFAENDWLASPKDVARLRRELRVEPILQVNMTEFKPKWNHIDFLYAKSAGLLVNPRIHQLLEQYSG